MKIVLLKYFKKFLYLFFLLSVCLAILEFCFRYQLIDFYSAELKGLNTKEQLRSKSNNVLIFGDSFTAHPESYVSFLRSEFPKLNFINSSIPGTGMKQHELIFNNRIQKFNPKVIIYQFYVGNDFTDIEHPINFNEASFFKNIYWIVSEKILILQYLNFKLAFLNSNNQKIEALQETSFSLESYNNRVKLYNKSDPTALNNTILLSDQKRKYIYKLWTNKIAAIKELISDSTPVYLLVIPQNAQINTTYLNRNIKLGASLTDSILQPDYPLVKTIAKDFNTWNIINPLLGFKEIKNNDSLYYQNDPHLTLLGQKELGKIVAKELGLNE